MLGHSPLVAVVRGPVVNDVLYFEHLLWSQLRHRRQRWGRRQDPGLGPDRRDRRSRPSPGAVGGQPEGLWVDAARHKDLPRCDYVVVVRVESGLFFANADHVRHAIRDQVTPATVAVVLDAETTGSSTCPQPRC
jgi:MFS superfamily sulfate permease-like transporter